MAYKNISILGVVGVPANYGGFETLAENLVRYHDKEKLQCSLTVYCSTKSYARRDSKYLSSKLKYIPLKANGPQSVLYDSISLIRAAFHSDTILLLGVSGAMLLPVINKLTRIKIVTNIDGIEWKRAKWNGLAKKFLRFSEKMAVKYSHEIVADNKAIADYVSHEYSKKCNTIAYGGDHAIEVARSGVESVADDLVADYYFSLCRIEPENNIEMILEAFSLMPARKLVFVGNWDNSNYGIMLKSKFSGFPNIFLKDPVYDELELYNLRNNASLYVHGHSAGGTNPSLVEMMYFSIPIFAFDCSFNRHTTLNSAAYFSDSNDLVNKLSSIKPACLKRNALSMINIAEQHYTWDKIGHDYFRLFD